MPSWLCERLSVVPQAVRPQGLFCRAGSKSAVVQKRAGSSVGAVQLVSCWVPDFWDKSKGLATEMEVRGTTCFETHKLFWHKGHVLCRSVRLSRAHLGLKQAFHLPALLTTVFRSGMLVRVGRYRLTWPLKLQ